MHEARLIKVKRAGRGHVFADGGKNLFAGRVLISEGALE